MSALMNFDGYLCELILGERNLTIEQIIGCKKESIPTKKQQTSDITVLQRMSYDDFLLCSLLFTTN